MYEMTLQSLGLFVGKGSCNANCKHCAGIVHRKNSPKEDGVVNEELFLKTLSFCYAQGAKSISITSSGEPTLSPLSVTKTLSLIQQFNYDWINLYSNGIRIGTDESFCMKYLSRWKDMGLKTVYVTVHSLDLEKNAQIYGVDHYPSLDKIVSKIHNSGLILRANIVLSKENVCNFDDYVTMVEGLCQKGFNHISAWPIRNYNDVIDEKLAPSYEELHKMGQWAEIHNSENCRIRLLQKVDDLKYKRDQKLTLFPDGTLSSNWCN
jgi:molybdenum cofactor biosynthesis enzyme MoaA